MTTKKLSVITVVMLLALGCTSISSNSPKISQVEAIPSTIGNASTETGIKAIPKLRSGSFVSGEHPTNGKASIVQENGIYLIELDQTFKTSENGPDLYVILHRSPNILNISKPPDFAIAEGDYVLIAPLKSFNGKQRYAIPQNIQPENYKSVAIWCRKFNATFGFAPLSGA